MAFSRSKEQQLEDFYQYKKMGNTMTEQVGLATTTTTTTTIMLTTSVAITCFIIVIGK